MAVLNKAAFEALYGTSGTVFPDNTTGEISEGDMRQFGKDIADSLFDTSSLSGGLNITVVQIGDWNMDSTADILVAHGIADYKKIRGVDIVIRDDSDAQYSPLMLPSGLLGGYYILNFAGLNPTTIQLNRVTSGFYDTTAYDSTSYNRGFITITHVD
jgi:hypothetical protein